ncbi:hypothetical protein [Thiorhodococcus minor]|uniref:Uncharacterized protein n=1 Tax=Thiorhodococcus minor TaxID=57489 RepID=A0A6M0JZE2_9GAMM|nr:hypothetical protein [Thiorhodococcus minor]NEV62431.1 hypothetical protein [Thiorhodococcus minor]
MELACTGHGIGFRSRLAVNVALGALMTLVLWPMTAPYWQLLLWYPGLLLVTGLRAAPPLAG